MDNLHHPDDPRFDPEAQGRFDRGRIRRALNASLAAVLVLVLVYSAQGSFDVAPLTVQPRSVAGLLGILTAPLLHGSLEHVTANAVSLLMLGVLAGSVYPKATLRALPLLWLGGGIGAWLLGQPGSHHLGASGLTHGLGFMVFLLGLIRRDRAAIATGMIAFLFYGGMVLSVLPREAGVSWESHLGGAIAGALAAILLRKADPALPRKRYSWEDEEDQEEEIGDAEYDLPPPQDVPVLWHRPQEQQPRGVVIQFPPREPPRHPQDS